MYLVRVNQYLSLPLSSAASRLVSLPSRLPPTASAFPSLPLPLPQLREPTTEPLWPNAVRVSRILYFTTGAHREGLSGSLSTHLCLLLNALRGSGSSQLANAVSAVAKPLHSQLPLRHCHHCRRTVSFSRSAHATPYVAEAPIA
jgi:hypothetical protein